MWWSVACVMWRIEALMGAPGTATRNKSAIASPVPSAGTYQHVLFAYFLANIIFFFNKSI
jgi:hypothetical protein